MARLCSPAAMRVPFCLLLFLPFLPVLFAQMLGGLVSISPLGGEARRAADLAVAEYNKVSNTIFYYRLLSIVKAERQVVAGFLYHLTVELVNTLCKKKKGLNMMPWKLEDCDLPLEEQEKEICELKVLIQPWLRNTELKYKRCEVASS